MCFHSDLSLLSMKPLYQFICFLFLGLLFQSHAMSYMDTNLSYQERVSQLLSAMTLEEKVGQMCQFVGFNYLNGSTRGMTAEEILQSDSQAEYIGYTTSDIADMVVDGKVGSFLHVLTAVEANQIQELALQSRLKIPALIGIDAIHGNGMVRGATVYPSPISIAATFTDEYAYRVGRETALEMRATGSHWAFTPNIDVSRDPRWGRVGETFGEDTLLVSNMGTSMIRGLQTEDYAGADKVIACAKHLIAGSEPVNGLNFSPMDLSERSLREIHLKPYKDAIDAGVFTIMNAHHEINGVPCVMHKELMEDIMRDEYGFDGFIVSDWLDIERLVDLHHVAEDFTEACYLAVDGGTDMHMHGPGFLEAVVSLVEEGRLSEERIDAACAKILLAKFKLGLFENPFVEIDKIPAKTFTKAHQKTALEIAEKSIVLLKNEGLLPLRAEPPRKILVTGPNANNQTILGDWALQQPEENVTTVYEGIKSLGEAKGHTVDFFESNWDIRKISEQDIANTVAHAANYDTIVTVIGDNSMRYLGEKRKVSGENVARSDINLAGKQLRLVQALHALGKDLVVVMVNGKPISEPWIESNINGIIEAWEPGSFGGEAIAGVLFGEVNPSGKLPLTFARSVGHLQMIYNHKPSYHFKKYAFGEVSPLYPFGHGLSYSDFKYENLHAELASDPSDDCIHLEVDIHNNSNRAGDEVVQLYIRDEKSSITRPVKELIDYKRLSFQADERKRVRFEIRTEQLAFYNASMERVVEPGVFRLMVGRSSGDKDLLTTSIEIPNAHSFE